MRPSSLFTYALRALVDMAIHEETGPVKTAQIARRQGIPLQVLEQILNRLKRQGILVAERGPRGGYCLIRHPSQITVSRIFEILEGKTAAKGKIIPASDPSASIWKQVEKAVQTTLDATTLEALVTQAREQIGSSFKHRFTFHI